MTDPKPRPNDGRYVQAILFCAALLTPCLALDPGKAAEGRSFTASVLQVLFPAGKILADKKTACSGMGTAFGPISRKGLTGLIDLESARHIDIDGDRCIIAFEAYYTGSDSSLRKAWSDCATQETGTYRKLVQAILMSRSSRKLLSVLPGFPVETDGWFCSGDVCTIPSLRDLRPQGGSYFSVELARGFVPSISFFSVQNSNVLLTAADLPRSFGSGEAGCEVGAEYAVSRGKDGMQLVRTTDCSGDGCTDMCATFGIPSGRKTVVIQQLR